MNNKMPLIIFNYTAAVNGVMNVNGHSQSVEIPRYAHDKRWKLVGVNAQYMNDAKEDFRVLEIDLPELLTTQNVLYATKSVGDVALPTNTLRFYVNTYELSEVDTTPTLPQREDSVFKSLSQYPDLDLGVHRLENTVLNLNVKAKIGNSASTLTNLEGYSIILEYEE